MNALSVECFRTLERDSEWDSTSGFHNQWWMSHGSTNQCCSQEENSCHCNAEIAASLTII